MPQSKQSAKTTFVGGLVLRGREICTFVHFAFYIIYPHR